MWLDREGVGRRERRDCEQQKEGWRLRRGASRSKRQRGAPNSKHRPHPPCQPPSPQPLRPSSSSPSSSVPGCKGGRDTRAHGFCPQPCALSCHSPGTSCPPPPAGKGWGCLRCQPGLSSILILPELLHVGLSEKAGRCGADASEAESWASDASFPFHCAALSVSSRLLIASRCSSRNTGLRALSSRILTFHLIASNSLR